MTDGIHLISSRYKKVISIGIKTATYEAIHTGTQA